MLFNFTLVPLDQIQPWGKEGEQYLSWFGLTDGQYWIQAGDDALFEYSAFVRRLPGMPRYCDYQVVRLHEDLIEMAPFVLEEIPTSLIPYISGESGLAWDDRVEAWSEATDGKLPDDQYGEIVFGAAKWIGDRTLDTAYLSPSTNIRMWSDRVAVNIEWENSKKLFDGVPAWSAVSGTFQLSRQLFIEEVRSFHGRLMEQMAVRIESVLAGALPKTVNIDSSGLRNEHLQRCREIESVFANPVPTTEWNVVSQAIAAIERGVNIAH